MPSKASSPPTASKRRDGSGKSSANRMQEKDSSRPASTSTPSSSSPKHSATTRHSSIRFVVTALIGMLVLASVRPLYRSYGNTLWRSTGFLSSSLSSTRHASTGSSTSSLGDDVDVDSAVRLTPNQARYTLPSGDVIPGVALGTWKAGRGEVGAAVTAALKAVSLSPSSVLLIIVPFSIITGLY